MTLSEAIDSYIRLKRALGAVFTSDSRILRSFGRTLGDILVTEIEPRAVHEFCRGAGPPTRWWERKHQALLGFFSFLVTRGYMASSPLPELRPHVPRSFEPYVYSRDELQRLLDATTILEDSRSPLQHLTFRTLLLTLYAAGLRPSEGLRLRCCDVDLGERVLSIWDTKFFKSRLVPIGASLAAILATYHEARKQTPVLAAERSAFFASRKGTAITLNKLEQVFVQLREHAEVRRPADARWQPRLHDLRHAFAVHRLVAWYREGVDVQAHLPLLSTYLGHINVSGTKAYLTMTPELLAEASKRFEQYVAGDEDEHDV